jgi:hypothetical protein
VKLLPFIGGVGLFASLYWALKPREAMAATSPSPAPEPEAPKASSPAASAPAGGGGGSPSSAPLGLRAIDLARSQLGTAEQTGNNDGAQIAKYFSGATRITNGVERPIGWVSGWDWCAAFASWCAFEARVGTERVPHGWRIAVWELVRDARESGAWRDWFAGAPNGPKPGDLMIYRRKGDPRQPGQTGHVARCVTWDGTRLVTIGGNEKNAVTEQDNAFRLGDVVGFISYS